MKKCPRELSIDMVIQRDIVIINYALPRFYLYTGVSFNDKLVYLRKALYLQ